MGFKEAVAAIKKEADGKILYAELRAELKAIADPGIQEVKSAIMGMPVNGVAHKGDPLRAAVAAGAKVGINQSGRLTGVRMYIGKRGMPRGFSSAPRDLNAPGWEHPGGRGGENVPQTGLPGFFDDTLKPKIDELREAIVAAYERMLQRIARR